MPMCPILRLDGLLDEKTDAWGKSYVHRCLYDDFDGKCRWTDWSGLSNGIRSVEWNGMDGFEIWDGELGLLLDLDEGTLTVYKDDCRLGVMMGGLTGEYCWTATIQAHANSSPHIQNVRNERAPLSTSEE
mmetsp:Transcript_16730/g.25454  ORF Transcript_16730/g.25454 Transcript_16730/m.25454 type:complete len:130 (+) Transcript_16730:126-515(+)|eukprot:CAMPEP_0196169060 /NCGR_PEP_ID=MMETSP0911-20130528/3693_1 /TAXON_ID=49265 /ORGANISM="Thalassiosira rotula, Strain GSO102" /LENGTH=129 /DNA_ID=CAMNT_0041435241 /DNA_START=205 /DNA_END=594 /DNA_ORIENTATION=+